MSPGVTPARLVVPFFGLFFFFFFWHFGLVNWEELDRINNKRCPGRWEGKDSRRVEARAENSAKPRPLLHSWFNYSHGDELV